MVPVLIGRTVVSKRMRKAIHAEPHGYPPCTKAALRLGHARADEPELGSVEMKANTCISADTLPRGDRVAVP
jgi:hypothetical protein